jgi:3-oxoacyl-[acyl-carrier protein] reductase
LVQAVAEALGPVDVLVSNAGLSHVQPLEDITATQFDEMLAVNLRAPFLLAQRAVPAMRERGFGHEQNYRVFTGGPSLGPSWLVGPGSGRCTWIGLRLVRPSSRLRNVASFG